MPATPENMAAKVTNHAVPKTVNGNRNRSTNSTATATRAVGSIHPIWVASASFSRRSVAGLPENGGVNER